jgi:hypothetical protein
LKKRKSEEIGTSPKVMRLPRSEETLVDVAVVQKSEEPLVGVAVAKWWRKQPQDVRNSYTNKLPRSNNSDTLLAGIMRSD